MSFCPQCGTGLGCAHSNPKGYGPMVTKSAMPAPLYSAVHRHLVSQGWERYKHEEGNPAGSDPPYDHYKHPAHPHMEISATFDPSEGDGWWYAAKHGKTVWDGEDATALRHYTDEVFPKHHAVP